MALVAHAGGGLLRASSCIEGVAISAPRIEYRTCLEVRATSSDCHFLNFLRGISRSIEFRHGVGLHSVELHSFSSQAQIYSGR